MKDHGRKIANKGRKHSLSIVWQATWLKFEAKLHFPMAKNTQLEYSSRYTIIPTSTCVYWLIINFRIPFSQLIYSQYSTRFFFFFQKKISDVFFQNFNISENNIVSVELAQVLRYSNSAPWNIHTLPLSQPRWTSTHTGTLTEFWIDCGD